MSLRRKTLLVLGALLLAQLLALTAVSLHLLLKDYEYLEKRRVVNHLRRTMGLLEKEIASLRRLGRSLADSESIHEFLAGARSDFLNQFGGPLYADLGLSLLLCADAQGGPPALSLDSAGQSATTPQTLDRLRQHGLLGPGFEEDGDGPAGIVMLPEGPIIVVSHSVGKLDQAPAGRMALVLGRRLDDRKVRELADLAVVELEVRPIGPWDKHPRLAQLVQPGPDVEPAIAMSGPDKIQASLALPDVLGRPALVVTVRNETTILKQGSRTMHYFLAAALLTGLAVSAVALWLLERTILARLAGLSNQVLDVGKSEAVTARVAVNGSDELAEVAHAVNTMMHALEQSQIERTSADLARQAATRRIVAAREQEQRHLAKELHDGAAQSLTALCLALHNARAQMPPQHGQQLQQAIDLSNLAIKQVRDASHGLYPRVLESMGLAQALKAMARQNSAAMDVSFFCPPDMEDLRLDSRAELALFRIAQEALSNALRHSQAELVSLDLERAGSALVLAITDNGKGFTQKPGQGLGLLSMKERAESVGGSLEISSCAGQTVVRAMVPFVAGS